MISALGESPFFVVVERPTDFSLLFFLLPLSATLSARACVLLRFPSRLQDEQNGIRTKLKALDAQRDAVRAQQKAIREKCQYVKVEDIDRAIDELENKMSHSSMSLNDEKKLVAQISDLRKSKTLVKELVESSGGVGRWCGGFWGWHRGPAAAA